MSGLVTPGRDALAEALYEQQGRRNVEDGSASFRPAPWGELPEGSRDYWRTEADRVLASAVTTLADAVREPIATALFGLLAWEPGPDETLDAYSGRIADALIRMLTADQPAAENDALHRLVSDWEANGNSRALGDPTAATWHACARQLRLILDGKPPYYDEGERDTNASPTNP